MGHARRLAGLLLASIVFALGPAQAPLAQSPLPTVHLSTNQALVGAGNTLSVTIGVEHTGAPVFVDLLFGVILPGGDSVIYFEGPGLTPGAGHVSQLASIRPMFANLPLVAGVNVLLPDFFRYTWQGHEPLGNYQFFFAATAPGAFADGRIDGGDLLALQLVAVNHVAPAAVTVETGQAVSAVVSANGGTINAVGSDGTEYALRIPPGALEGPTTITLTPVQTMTGLAGSLQLVEAVRAEPAGLTFGVPASLTIRPGSGPAPAGSLGILTASNGAGLELPATAVTSDGAVLIANIKHFSVAGAGIPGSAVDLLNSIPASSYSDAISIAAATGNEAGVPLLLQQWYDLRIRPFLQTGQTDAASLLAGLRDFLEWEMDRTLYGSNQAPINTPALVSRAAEGRLLTGNGLRAAIARQNGLCASTRTLARAEEVMRLQALAQSTSESITMAAFVNLGILSSPLAGLDMTGLTLASVRDALCVQVSIFSTTFPGSASLEPGVPATLIVNGGLAMRNGSAPLFTPPLQVVVDAIGATPAQRLGQTNSSGNFQTTFVPQTTGMSLNVLVAMTDGNFPYLSLGLAVATKAIGGVGGVIVTPSQTTIEPGASRQFSATVEGTTNQGVTWSVTGGGTITQAGLFTSNGTLGTFFVKATSVLDPDSVGIAQVTVQQPGGGGSLVVFPTGEVLPRGGTRQFFAAVSPGGALVPVTWSVDGAGTISADGLFTAGNTGTANFHLVTATSIADPSVTGTATVRVSSLRVGQYTSIPLTAEVQFFHEAGLCGDPTAFNTFPNQPGTWTLDVTSLPTAPQPYMVTVTNTDPGAPAVRYDIHGNGIDDTTHRLQLQSFDGGANITYFKFESNAPAAPLVAVLPTGLCPTDEQRYPARAWKVFFPE